MKLSVKTIALYSWLIAGFAQVIIELQWRLQGSAKIVLQGIDISRSISHFHTMVMLHVGVGIVLASSAFFLKKASSILVAAASLWFLINWFPWSSVRIVGIFETYRYKWLLAPTLEFQAVVVLRDIVLPIAFTVALILSIRDIISNLQRDGELAS